MNLKRLDILFFIGIAFIFFLEIFLLFSPVHEERIRTAYLEPLIVLMTAYLVMRLGLPRKPVLLLPPVFAVWHLITRILDGDRYLQASGAYVYMILLASVVLYLAPFLADAKRRETLMTGVASLYVLLFSVTAWIAVIAALSGHPWSNPLDPNSILGINRVYWDPYRLNVLNIHPNISVIFFYTSLALLVYLFFRTKKLWLRLACLAPAAGLYLAICMAGSISAILITSVMLGMVLFALIYHAKKTFKGRIPLAALALVATVAVGLATYPLVIRWTSSLYETMQEQLPSAAAETMQAEPEPSATPVVTPIPMFAQERLDTRVMSANMGARFLMYSSAFLCVADHPLTLLTGELWDDAMARSARLIDYPFQNHVHNSFLQTLVVGGGISFVMAIVFTVLLAAYGLRLFFRKGVPMHIRLLVLAPVGMLIHSITESILFIDTRLPNLLFFFLAGMIIAYSMELCPKKERARARRATV